MQRTISSEITSATADEICAYMQGALHDGTYSAAHRTHRVGQANEEWLHHLRFALQRLGHRSWIYREGRDRCYWVLETSAGFLSKTYDASALVGRPEGLAYVRGYFDAEGGMPRRLDARLYFQLCQKDLRSITVVAGILESHSIECGVPHNPSPRVDPNYWRVFVRASSWNDFMTRVGSWHPVKRSLIDLRLAHGNAAGALVP